MTKAGVRYGVAAVLGLALLVLAGPGQAHLWHEAAEDIETTTIEALVSALERAAAELEDGVLVVPENVSASSEHVAFELMRPMGRLQELPPETVRILVTYDALRFGVVDETGAFAPDASMAIWLELVRPADAPSVAPFRERLDAWRATVLEETR